MKTIYLCGPITGLSYSKTVDWRQEFASLLISADPEDLAEIRVLSPMRGKGYLAGEQAIKDGYSEQVLSASKAILTRDRFDVQRCDLLVANFLGAEVASIGSAMEIAWADLLRKPIIVLMKADNVHNRAMLREAAGFILEDLRTAAQVAVEILRAGL